MKKYLNRREAVKTISMGVIGSLLISDSGCSKSGQGENVLAETETIRLLMSYGQSNSIGDGSKDDAVTTSQVYDSLMFSGGVRPDPANIKFFSSFLPLIEGSKNYSETPLSGCAETIIANFYAVSVTASQKKMWQFLCAAPGVGGKNISDLSKGSPTGYYIRAVQYALHAKNNCINLKKGLEVPIMLWTHGSADISDNPSTKKNYYDHLNKLISDYAVDLVAVTGQQNDIIWIGNQECKNSSIDQDGVAQAQYNVMLDNPMFTLSNPSYILGYEYDKKHYRPVYDRIQGAYYGIYASQWMLNGIKPRPLCPENFTVDGHNIIIKYHVPQPPLVFDTSWIEEAKNMGFRVQNAADEELSISSVTITGEDTVTIKTNSDPTGGRVLYGRPLNNTFIDRGTYLMLAGRGNLRDSQGDYITRYNFPMHNYSLVYNIKI